MFDAVMVGQLIFGHLKPATAGTTAQQQENLEESNKFRLLKHKRSVQRSLQNASHSPTSLLTVDRPFRVVLTVFEVRLQLVEPQCGCATEACVIAADLQFGQHVAHDAGYGPEMS